MDRAFVKFVEDHTGHTGQLRVVLQPAGQDPLRHHLDPGGLGDLALKTDGVAHGLPHRLSQGLGHIAGRRGRCDTARLQHHDPSRLGRKQLQKRQRHPGGLARPWRGRQHHVRAAFQGGEQFGQGGINGQFGHGQSIAVASPFVHACRFRWVCYYLTCCGYAADPAQHRSGIASRLSRKRYALGLRL